MLFMKEGSKLAKFLCILALACPMGCGQAADSVASASAGSMAVVYLDSILEILVVYRDWRQSMGTLKEKVDRYFARRQAELGRIHGELQTLGPTMDKVKYERKMKDFNGDRLELEQQHAEWQQALFKSEQGAGKHLDSALRKILERLSKERKISSVFNGNMLLFVDRNQVMDLTIEVARLMKEEVNSLAEFVPELSFAKSLQATAKGGTKAAAK